LRGARLDEWTLDTVEDLAGPVPGRIMRRAAEDRLALCLNFDGEHVDPVVARRATDVVGARAVMAMTDRTERPRLGDQDLHRVGDSTLWYQHDGIVAAGSQGLPRQVANMRASGLSEPDIHRLTVTTPARVFGTAAPIADAAEDATPA
jgi:N-acetylglucosamine-6-phosphate deacetylase